MSNILYNINDSIIDVDEKTKERVHTILLNQKAINIINGELCIRNKMFSMRTGKKLSKLEETTINYLMDTKKINVFLIKSNKLSDKVEIKIESKEREFSISHKFIVKYKESMKTTINLYAEQELKKERFIMSHDKIDYEVIRYLNGVISLARRIVDKSNFNKKISNVPNWIVDIYHKKADKINDIDYFTPIKKENFKFDFAN